MMSLLQKSRGTGCVYCYVVDLGASTGMDMERRSAAHGYGSPCMAANQREGVCRDSNSSCYADITIRLNFVRPTEKMNAR
jgi:hypothetical protein